MIKMLAVSFLVLAVAGCGESVNCETPEVQQTELHLLGQLDSRDVTTPPSGPNSQLKVASVTQFTNKQTGVVTCNVTLSYVDSATGKREEFFRPFVFSLEVADDDEHFTVALAQ